MRILTQIVVTLALLGGLVGTSIAYGLVYLATHSPQFFSFFPLKVTPGLCLVAMLVAGFVGFLSAALPAYHASRTNIVQGLRHIG